MNDLLPIALDGFLTGRFYWKRRFYKIHVRRVFVLERPLTAFRRHTGYRTFRKTDRVLASFLGKSTVSID